MANLPSQAVHHVLAALGWLELGNPRQALAELDQLPADDRRHPDVLETAWRARAKLRHWIVCATLGEALIMADPSRPSGWINRSFALHELKRTREAWEALLPAAQKFPRHETIAYNLACYACQLGDHEAARRWLANALDAGNAEEIKLRALDDPDLAPMRDEVRRM